MTSCGLNGGPLRAEGIYPATICCNLYRGKMGHIVNGISKVDRPFITHGGNERFITGIRTTTVIGYKYFDLYGKRKLTVTTRGRAEGMMEVYAGKRKIGEIGVKPSEDWKENSAQIEHKGPTALYFRFLGNGRLDFLAFRFDD